MTGTNKHLQHVRMIREIIVRQLSDLERIKELTDEGWIVTCVVDGKDAEGDYWLFALGC